MNDNQLWELVANLAVDYINAKSKVSDLREEFARIMSEQRWVNKSFDSLVNSVLDTFDILERKFKRPGDRTEDWLADAVVVVVDGSFANSVLSNRRIVSQLSRDELSGMENAADIYEELFSRRGRDTYRRDDQRRERGDSYQSRDLGVAGRSGGGGRTQSRSSRATSVGGWDALANIGDQPAARVEEPVREQERYVPPLPEAVQTKPVTQARVETLVEGPDFRKDRPYDHFMRDGEEWMLAHLSNWKLSGDGDLGSGIPKLYNCNLFVKYHVKAENGHVREEFEPVTDENRYARHEVMNLAVDEPVAPKAASSGFGRSQLEQRAEQNAEQEAKRKPTRIEELLQTVDEEQFRLVNSSPVDSLGGAMFSAHARMRANDERARVDLHLLRTPHVAIKPNQNELIEQVYNTNSLADAQKKLNELKSEFDVAIWNELNSRFTKFLLRALKYQFNFLEITKMNFSKHYDKVLETIENVNGAPFAAQFAHRAGYITDLATGHFNKADVASYTSDLFDQEGAAGLQLVSFVDFVSTVAFDCTLDELGIGTQVDDSETGVCVTAVSNRELHQALRNMYSKLNDALPSPAKIRVYLSTLDNRLIEVLPFADRMDAFVLAPV